MTIRMLTGDCRDVLPTLEAESVHCVVTSPPYYGLRDYGVDGQMGLEESPDEYITGMVAVFREVRRVLRKDGTVWLNLGSSYVSANSGPNQSRCGEHVLAYGNGGTKQPDSQASDYACLDPCDELQGEKPNHHDRSLGTDQLQQPTSPRPLQKDRDSEHLDCVSGIPADALRNALASTIPSLSGYVQDVSDREAKALADRIVSLTSVGDEQAFARKAVGNLDINELQRILVARNWDKEPLALACLYLSMACRRWKAKDLMNMPALLAEALQCDGWYVRSDIIWHKSSPMPESVTDRPTSAHEHVFLLSKSSGYFFDAEAVRESLAEATLHDSRIGTDRPFTERSADFGNGTSASRRLGRNAVGNISGRNIRNVWTIATEPYPGSHFAVMPSKLVEPCIKAGTSEKGCCAECGAPWVRKVESVTENLSNAAKAGTQIQGKGHISSQVRNNHDVRNGPTSITKTLGWSPSCQCKAMLDGGSPQSCTVLDPFSGAGTTGLVADRLGRNAILIELNPEYAGMAEKRLHDDAGMFSEVTA